MLLIWEGLLSKAWDTGSILSVDNIALAGLLKVWEFVTIGLFLGVKFKLRFSLNAWGSGGTLSLSYIDSSLSLDLTEGI